MSQTVCDHCGSIFLNGMLAGQDWTDFLQSVKDTAGNEEPILYRLVGDEQELIDGRNRLRACQELGLEPRLKLIELADQDVKAFILRRNVHRRHLSKKDRQNLVIELKADGQSNRAIAATLQVSEATVRSDLSGAQFCAPDAKNIEDLPKKVTGTDGKEYPASSRKKPKVTTEKPPEEVVEMPAEPTFNTRRIVLEVDLAEFDNGRKLPKASR